MRPKQDSSLQGRPLRGSCRAGSASCSAGVVVLLWHGLHAQALEEDTEIPIWKLETVGSPPRSINLRSRSLQNRIVAYHVAYSQRYGTDAPQRHRRTPEGQRHNLRRPVGPGGPVQQAKHGLVGLCSGPKLRHEPPTRSRSLLGSSREARATSPGRCTDRGTGLRPGGKGDPCSPAAILHPFVSISFACRCFGGTEA